MKPEHYKPVTPGFRPASMPGKIAMQALNIPERDPSPEINAAI